LLTVNPEQERKKTMSGIQQTFEAKCREHWNRMNYSKPEKLKERILEVFAKNTDQHYAIVGVYRLVIPDWDEIEKLVGYPEAGMELCLFICQQCMEFDRKYHPNCMPGGVWMNWGFSSNSELDPWGISFENCIPIY
jgi:hypothetical protein